MCRCVGGYLEDGTNIISQNILKNLKNYTQSHPRGQ
jgi:hypothetical protein